MSKIHNYGDFLNEEFFKKIFGRKKPKIQSKSNIDICIEEIIKFLNDNHLNEISNDEVSEIFNKYKEERKILYEKEQEKQNKKEEKEEAAKKKAAKKKAEKEQKKKTKTNDSEIKTETDNLKDPGTIIFAISLVVITGVIIYFSFKNNSNNNDKDKKDNDNIDDDY